MSWLAALALCVQVLMPVLAQAHAASSARLVQVCTQTGIKQFAIDAENPTDSAPASHARFQGQHCPVCAVAQTSAPPTTLPQLFFSTRQAAAPPTADAALQPLSPFCVAAPRGPPSAA